MSFGFLREFLLHPTTTGAVAPSSTSLARKMVEWVDWPNVRAVVECGPGNGIFTEFIQKSLPPHAKFFAIETNPALADIFRQRHPRVVLYEDSVGNVKSLWEREGIALVDCIISGLPWASFSEDMQTTFLESMMAILKPGGRFVTFAYLHGLLLPSGRRFAERLPRYFSEISRSKTVWLNLPPALVYRCRR